MLVASILLVRHPLRGGAATAALIWSKLTPLALLPLLAGEGRAANARPRRFDVLFWGALGVVSALVFLPAMHDTTIGVFLARTFGFQSSRPLSESIWALFGGSGSGAVGVLTKVLHGLLAACVATFALFAGRLPRRAGSVALAAAAGAILICVQLCLSYFAISYVLWWVPLALVAGDFAQRAVSTA